MEDEWEKCLKDPLERWDLMKILSVHIDAKEWSHRALNLTFNWTGLAINYHTRANYALLYISSKVILIPNKCSFPNDTKPSAVKGNERYEKAPESHILINRISTATQKAVKTSDKQTLEISNLTMHTDKWHEKP
jgi:hypothetical protein